MTLLEALASVRAFYADAQPLSGYGAAFACGLWAWAMTLVVVRGFLQFSDRVAARTRTTLDDDLLARVRTPTAVLGPVVGAHVAGWFLGWNAVTGTTRVLEGLLATYVAVATFEILVIETWLEKRQGLKVPAPVRQLLIALAYIGVLLSIGGEVLGIDLTPLLATGSITSLVLGLALQGPLSNLFAGLVLHIERHPHVGDWLLVDGREGQVVEIGWRTTRLRLLSNDILVIPNAAMMNAQIVNFEGPSAETGRQVPVPVPFDVPPPVFEAWVRDVLRGIDGVVIPDDPRTKVWLVSVDDHCLRYVVRFFAREFRIHDDLESDFLKGLYARFAAEGVQFPARYQVVQVASEPAPAMAALRAQRPPGFPPGPPAA